MTRRAIQLGWLPRLRVKQTTEESYGRIYIGAINWLLMVVTLFLTVFFKSRTIWPPPTHRRLVDHDHDHRLAVRGDARGVALGAGRQPVGGGVFLRGRSAS